MHRRWASAAGATLVLLAVATASGCAGVRYYAQAIGGQMSMLAAARPIDDWLADDSTPAALKTRLQLAAQIRQFASASLALPDNNSYRSYADLKRPAVVWNVFATPELSLQLKTWCYPLFGCAGYRGYFDRARAEATGEALRAEGYDVNVAPVPAYSTLGWFDDPLLNTFIGWSEGELARLIFHELAHQVLYVKDDTAFNESFATAVEREGVRRWLRTQPAAVAAAYAAAEQRRADFLGLLLQARRELAEVYASADEAALKRERKQAVFAALQARYRVLRDGAWGGFAGYDRFFAQPLNGAHLAAVAAYNEWVPAFEAMMAQAQGDLPTFYRQVRQLADLPREQRRARLKEML